MSSFYGNMKNNSRSSFIIDKVYPSRVAMEEALTTHDQNESLLGDGVFVNRYVLIDYGYNDLTKKQINNFYANSVDSNTDFDIQTKQKNRVMYDSLYRMLTQEERNNIPQEWYKSYYYLRTDDAYQGYYQKLQSEITNDEVELAKETEKFYEIYSNPSIPLYERKTYIDRFIPIQPSPVATKIKVTEQRVPVAYNELVDGKKYYNGDSTIAADAATALSWGQDAIIYGVAPLDPHLTYYVKDSSNNYIKASQAQLATWGNYNVFVEDDIVLYYDVIWGTTAPDQLVNVGIPTENEIYHTHKLADYERFHAIYDRTVWMKIYIDNRERYIMVAQLDSLQPQLQMVADAPSCLNGSPHLDMRQSTDYNYLYHMPNNWKVALNRYIPTSVYSKYESPYYWYEQDPNSTTKTFDVNVQYPYLNGEGFDKQKQSKVISTSDPSSVTAYNVKSTTFENAISLIDVKSYTQYPQHIFRHVQLTADTYFPNRYYTVNNVTTQNRNNYKIAANSSPALFNIDKAYYTKKTTNGTSIYTYVPLRLYDEDNLYKPVNYKASTDYYYDNVEDEKWFTKSTTSTFSATAVYYELTWKLDSTGKRLTSRQNDTKRVDVYLPIIGTSISDIYDVIYGAPRYEQQDGVIGNLIGYATTEQYQEFLSRVDPNHRLNGSYWSDPANRFDITDDEYYELSPEIYPGLYDIPIYIAGNNKRRPYDDDRLLSELSPPYNNIGGEEASIGWALTLLKRYISELRFLAKGTMKTSNGEIVTGFGLQSDWTLDDKNAFGFINHRPSIITTFMPVENQVKNDNQYYYIKKKKYVPEYGEIEVYQKKKGSAINQNQFDQYFSEGNLYELPPTTSAYERHLEISYVPVTEEENSDFTTNQQYYKKESNNHYVIAYVITPRAEAAEITAAEMQQPGLCSYKQGYVITTNRINGNNIITKREYKVLAGVEKDNVYLRYGNVFPQTFWLQVTNTNDINNHAPSLNWINDLTSDKTRSETLTLLSAFTGNSSTYLVRTSDTDCQTYTQNIPPNSSGLGFEYIKTVNINEYEPITESNYDENKDWLYIRKEVETEGQLDYEIHHLWGKAVGLTLVEE